MTDRILIARIGAPHGVKGEVRLFAFGEDPLALKRYPLTDESGARRFKVQSLRAAKDHFVARLEGIADRNAAEALTNTDLFVPRDALPAAEDEDTFYHADLMGLRVEDQSGALLGTVLAMHDFGAGDVLEYTPEGGGRTLLLPFTKAAVPVVDVPGGRIVVVPDTNPDETPPEDADQA
ncbi:MULTISPECIES: ribosome maturation factor RimM [Azorhizobium]|uniref:Ribosome maturation factor RimM n=1 Tax=Azorhizobium caulinodans (strain ATCC 43989 / DSM 5975 / JCM 20966 / LMG 6465 / NBRC 14845 / NCIMB 13405 / ORS 571) TaxID=438753 RepID=RIMM_AZOC5|nr:MULTISPECIES: ribosome maturation factor RimM [Azorhizobium]A8IKV0.1 RecName: Full=Ribosome maturation factor RimM [Azorhizobium caulinodans ORS 571]TDU00753.1 16S rRNA processing protein RimM [Azorhizobium sp. AG788]BAF89951.1 16S rRNA processing protein [Azorhizobium caulinodans ORS 571]